MSEQQAAQHTEETKRPLKEIMREKLLSYIAPNRLRGEKDARILEQDLSQLLNSLKGYTSHDQCMQLSSILTGTSREGEGYQLLDAVTWVKAEMTRTDNRSPLQSLERISDLRDKILAHKDGNPQSSATRETINYYNDVLVPTFMKQYENSLGGDQKSPDYWRV